MSRGWQVLWILALMPSLLCTQCAQVETDGDGDGDADGDGDGDADGDGDGDDLCDSVDCGSGWCDQATGSCDCDEGLIFDPIEGTCVAEACEGGCAEGQYCDQSNGECRDFCTPDRAVGDFIFCAETSDSSYSVVVSFRGSGELDLSSSDVRLNGSSVDLTSAYDSDTQTFSIVRPSVEPSKYSYLFRMRSREGADIRPLFIPMWIGRGIRYADFTWHDGILYQILTDRFLNGNPDNDIDNALGTLAEVTDTRNQWQGGDFAGITAKIREGYFSDMGINALWISSPILNSHNSNPAVGLSDTRRFASYHSYHPVATGYTHLDALGYDNPIEPAFGTAAELHELVNEAHRRGIRVIPDFVANHVHREARLYEMHPDWFFEYNWCDGRWEDARIGCWFTSDMPDFDYGAHPDATQVVVNHAIWMIQEFNFDGFRADALKHMDDSFVRALKSAIVEQIETTVDDHALSIEPTIFYIVGESLGGWARYHVREDMVQGQVDEEYSNHVRASLFTFSSSVRELADFAIPNDTAYLTPQPVMDGVGGYPGAVMGNYFGNHDQWRALTVALDSGAGMYDAHRRLRLAQTFLMTSPGNIPMLYQGDDIGTEGEQDPDNRRTQRFSGLSADEEGSLENVRRAGRLREEHPAIRRGRRENVVLEDWYWVYRLTSEDDEVIVAINRDDDKLYTPPEGFVDGLGNCHDGVVPILSSCIFVRE